jgi:carboxyl-terminal processing protease
MTKIFLRTLLIVLFTAANLSFAASPSEKPKTEAAPTQPPAKKETPPGPEVTMEEALSYFETIASLVKSEYAENITNRKLLEGALSGMLSSLDPHSTFMNREVYHDYKNQTEGHFGGLGIEVVMEDGLLKVIAPMDDTPASKAGLQAGDLIVGIDDLPVFGLTDMEAVKKLRGEPGTKVKITVHRGNENIEKTLERAVINIKPVKSRAEGNIGYIRISTFNEKTADELAKAIKSLQKEIGNKLIGYVVDLRNNPGGLLPQGISVANMFLNKGVIVSAKDREHRNLEEFKAKGPDLTMGLPVVVLVNSGSASASEIVAGALQGNHRALIVGTQTFGKGSIQKLTPIGDIGAVKVTIALFYTPTGQTIQKHGITPDIKIEQQLDLQTINSDKQLREAYLKEALEDSSKPKLGDASKTPAKNMFAKEKTFKDLPDYQLQQSFNILRALSFDHSMLSRFKQ